MKKNYLLLLALGLTCSPAMAQENKGEVISLLPDGVTLNIGSERKMDKQKNLVVVGSPKKGYKAFFAASDATHGEELWVTDGTKEGTRMVADIQTGEGSSSPAYVDPYESVLTGVNAITNNAPAQAAAVYTVEGVQVRANVAAEKATEGLQKGVYIVNGKKVVVR